MLAAVAAVGRVPLYSEMSIAGLLPRGNLSYYDLSHGDLLAGDGLPFSDALVWVMLCSLMARIRFFMKFRFFIVTFLRLWPVRVVS